MRATTAERHASACRYNNEVPFGSRRSPDSFLAAWSLPRIPRIISETINLRCRASSVFTESKELVSWQKKHICGKNSPKAGSVGLH